MKYIIREKRENGKSSYFLQNYLPDSGRKAQWMCCFEMEIWQFLPLIISTDQVRCWNTQRDSVDTENWNLYLQGTTFLKSLLTNLSFCLQWSKHLPRDLTWNFTLWMGHQPERENSNADRGEDTLENSSGWLLIYWLFNATQTEIIFRLFSKWNVNKTANKAKQTNFQVFKLSSFTWKSRPENQISSPWWLCGTGG